MFNVAGDSPKNCLLKLVGIEAPLDLLRKRIIQAFKIPLLGNGRGSTVMIPLRHQSISAKQLAQLLLLAFDAFSQGAMQQRTLPEHNGSVKKLLPPPLAKQMFNGLVCIMHGY